MTQHKPPPKNARAAAQKTVPGSDSKGDAQAKAKTAATKTKGNAKGKAKRYVRPRGGPAKPIADLIPQVGRSAFRRFGFVQSSIVTRWAEIVGDKYAGCCTPESIRFPPGEKSEGILQLIAAPAHAPVIQHVTPEIIIRVNRFFGYKAVSRVKIRQGRVQPRCAEKQAKAPPALKPIPMELGDSLRDIGDPELRTVLESLARGLSAAKDEQGS